MEHKLRVLVRFNADLNCAAIEVRGCLTRPGCSALLPVISRARLLSGGMRVVVNLRKARHIDDSALERLRFLCAEEPHRPEDAAQIEAPATLPECPAVRVLHNADAARLAFFRRSPSALGGSPAPDASSVHGDQPVPVGRPARAKPVRAKPVRAKPVRAKPAPHGTSAAPAGPIPAARPIPAAKPAPGGGAKQPDALKAVEAAPAKLAP